jgi:alkanesulfonate monooxygenase SsuD/methylene tetrahydromethanopterin reductase-like flavin-dependent oxidoreductase (luciferase family)
VGTGEALNEHVTGAKWPAADERQEMLEEAVKIITELFTGKQLTYDSKHYRSRRRRPGTASTAPDYYERGGPRRPRWFAAALPG